MPVRLFTLRNVPVDEIEDIRALLTNNHIDFYETPAGNWGISLPAIWLKDESQLDVARELLHSYQKQRSEKIKNEFEQLRLEGKDKSIKDSLKESPARFIVYILIVIGILYISIKPFISFVN